MISVQTEFEPATENAALKQVIIERIQREGGITFRDFMAMALYQPGLGYYSSGREVLGREGDYLTSPEVSPLFGAVMGRQLRQMWETMGAPPRFAVVEAGAGTGALCRDVLRWAQNAAPAFLAAVSYTIAEPNPAAHERQQRLLAAEGLRERVAWAEELPPSIEGVILSNELLDAMPVHRVTTENAELREVYVFWDGAHFVEELRRPSTPEIEACFARLGLLPGDGCRAEVNLASIAWMREAASALARGFILTFDYGYEAAALFAPWRRDGTLLSFYRHNPSTDPYARIGREDITAHVDFTSLRRAGEEAGLTTLGLVPQSQFLMALGIGEALAPPAEGPPDLEEFYARRRAVMELVDSGGLGRIKVLVQTRGYPSAKLSGLEGDAD